MKKLGKILIGLVIVLLVVFIAAELALDRVILKGFNAAVPSALGVPATLENASLSLIGGNASLQGLHIGNPEGFKTDGLFDLDSVAVKLDNASLLTDTIIIKEITITGMQLTYEKGLRDSNLGALIEQLSAGKEDEPAEEEETEEEAEEEETGKKVVIENLTITDSQMNFSITGAAALTGGGSIPIPLPPITLTDLGKEKDGVTIPEAIRRILTAVAKASGTAIAGAGDLIGDGAKALGQGALAVGEGAADAGKAVVGGAADAGEAVVDGVGDAGKAVVGGVGDAGKAVGGALKNINPFKK